MKYYLDPPSEELKNFKFSIRKTFVEIEAQEFVLWSLIKGREKEPF